MEVLQNSKGRFYPYKGGYVPSVTTVLKCLNNEGLNYWRGMVGNAEADRISKEASDLGTEVHNLTQRVEEGGLLFHENPLVEQLTETYMEWVQTAVEDVLAIEVPLVGELYEMDYGGTIDRIYRLKTGKICIVDIKTSKKCNPGMGYQLAGLARLLAQSDMLDDIIGELDDVSCKIVRLRKDEPTKLPQVKQYDYSENIEVFRNNLSNYYLTRANEIPKEEDKE